MRTTLATLGRQRRCINAGLSLCRLDSQPVFTRFIGLEAGVGHAQQREVAHPRVGLSSSPNKITHDVISFDGRATFDIP